MRLAYPDRHVAPYVGAWIETYNHKYRDGSMGVAPYVGAWIETLEYSLRLGIVWSHPTWVRGLKPYNNNGKYQYLCRTLRGCVD